MPPFYDPTPVFYSPALQKTKEIRVGITAVRHSAKRFIFVPPWSHSATGVAKCDGDYIDLCYLRGNYDFSATAHRKKSYRQQ